MLPRPGGSPNTLVIGLALAGYRGVYRYAVEEVLDHSPAGEAVEHALISVLAQHGLRVSEATGADIGHLGLERGHRTLVITRKGGKAVTIRRLNHAAGNTDTALLRAGTAVLYYPALQECSCISRHQ